MPGGFVLGRKGVNLSTALLEAVIGSPLKRPRIAGHCGLAYSSCTPPNRRMLLFKHPLNQGHSEEPDVHAGFIVTHLKVLGQVGLEAVEKERRTLVKGLQETR